MRRQASSLFAIICVSLAVSCSESSPASPTPTATPPPIAATRVITVTGDLAFGYVDLGLTSERTFRITNSGTDMLTFTSLSAVGGTGASGYSETPSSGTIAPGASQTVSVRFTPTIAQVYSNVLTVESDRTSGGNQITVTGTGVDDLPLYIKREF
jgi:hypothetical protein